MAGDKVDDICWTVVVGDIVVVVESCSVYRLVVFGANVVVGIKVVGPNDVVAVVVRFVEDV